MPQAKGSTRKGTGDLLDAFAMDNRLPKVLNACVGDIPARGDTEFWEPRALDLLAILVERGPLSLRAIKDAMTRKGYKIGITVNLLSFLCLTHRVRYSREEKAWLVIKS